MILIDHKEHSIFVRHSSISFQGIDRLIKMKI